MDYKATYQEAIEYLETVFKVQLSDYALDRLSKYYSRYYDDTRNYDKLIDKAKLYNWFLRNFEP